MKKSRLFMVYMLLLTSSIFIAGCAAQLEKDVPCEVSAHSKKLRVLLHKLDTVTFEPRYSELERDYYRVRYAGQISDIVEAMIKRQHNRQTVACGMSLTPQQNQVFNQLSSQLQVQAKQLNELIKLQRTEYIKPQINKINQTCASCHQQLDIIPLD